MQILGRAVGVMMLCAACGDDGAAVDLGVDLAIAADLSAIVSPLGGACTADVNCTAGTKPVCFRKTLFNASGKLATAGGYCSSMCSTDSDCGDGGTCYDQGASGKWCFAMCKAAADCRQGYACFFAGTDHCYPNGNLTCDPAAGSGACTTQSDQPGGCLRDAHGTGNTGYCWKACSGEVGSCPITNGVKQQCVVYDQRSYRDPDVGTYDVYLGGVCIIATSMNVVGQECLSGAMTDRIDACADGNECYVASYFPNGDNLCHPLCTGAGGADGGVGCTGPATCHDVWGLLGTAKPIGMCL